MKHELLYDYDGTILKVWPADHGDYNGVAEAGFDITGDCCIGNIDNLKTEGYLNAAFNITDP